MTFEGKWGILYIERAIEQVLLAMGTECKNKKNIALFEFISMLN